MYDVAVTGVQKRRAPRGRREAGRDATSGHWGVPVQVRGDPRPDLKLAHGQHVERSVPDGGELLVRGFTAAGVTVPVVSSTEGTLQRGIWSAPDVVMIRFLR